MRYVVTLAGCLVILVQIIETSADCKKETIKKSTEKCDETYLVSSVKDFASMKKMCERVECLAKCKIDAVGDCANKEEFREHMFEFDPERWKVYYRFTCSNLDGVKEQFSGRCKDNKICPDMQTVNPKEKDKNVLCSSLEKLRNCTSMSENPQENCTAIGAKFQEDINKLGNSMSMCDNTDIKTLYTKYGGPDKCGDASGTTSPKLSIVTVSLTMFYWTVTQFRKF